MTAIAIFWAFGEALDTKTNPQGMSEMSEPLACQAPAIGADLIRNVTLSGECRSDSVGAASGGNPLIGLNCQVSTSGSRHS